MVDNLTISGDIGLRMKKRRATTTLRSAWAAAALLYWCAESHAGPADDNMIGAFESFCLDNLSAPERAIRMIDALGLAEVLEHTARSL
jgi:hypothetical protein